MKTTSAFMDFRALQPNKRRKEVGVVPMLREGVRFMIVASILLIYGQIDHFGFQLSDSRAKVKTLGFIKGNKN